MPILVTRTKVILPRRRAELLTRQRLLNMLYDLMDYKLVIIAAPAGYGKTSLLIDFAHQLDLTVCWYSIDALDRDLARFLAHFITAIANKYPGFGKQSMAALESNMQTRMDTDHLVTIIVNEAYEHIRD
jgi:LuxR family maltose regulon positive regulatory protein